MDALVYIIEDYLFRSNKSGRELTEIVMGFSSPICWNWCEDPYHGWVKNLMIEVTVI